MHQTSYWKQFLGINLACERKGTLDSSEEFSEWCNKTCLSPIQEENEDLSQLLSSTSKLQGELGLKISALVTN